jgi:hypothetical protein
MVVLTERYITHDELDESLRQFVPAGWHSAYAIPLRLIVGYGFMEHGSSLPRGSGGFGTGWIGAFGVGSVSHQPPITMKPASIRSVPMAQSS